MSTHFVTIALGGNKGDVIAAFRLTEKRLIENGIEIIRQSKLYRTKPLCQPNSPEVTDDYLNCVWSIKTKLSPEALLELLLQIEQLTGRIRKRRWDSRTLDLDILTFDQLKLSSSLLTIPHPELHKRAFVLVPLAEIEPELIVVSREKTVKQLLSALNAPEQQIIDVINFQL